MLLKTHSREKLIEAILFFASNTKCCGKTKLFKLLYLLDLEHFAQTGRSVTEEQYLAWEKGPVPVSLDDEWGDYKDDMANAFSIKMEKVIDHTQQTVVPNRKFDSAQFSKRELRIMEALAKKYEKHSATDMVRVVHTKGGPWDQVWQDSKGQNKPIPLELGAPPQRRDDILETAREYQSLKARYAS